MKGYDNMTDDKLKLNPNYDEMRLKVTSDNMLRELIDIFQLYIEYSEKSFMGNYSNLNINEVHAIQYIGSAEMPNVTQITEYLKITKGAVTKITKKLITNGYLTSYQIEGNRKEKYFKLTDKGQIIFNKHERIHMEAFQRDRKIFDQFDDDAKHVIFEFLNVLKSDLSNKLE